MTKPRKKLTPYQRIVRAAQAGRGVRLSADEAWQMGTLDDAITTRAMLDDDPEYAAQEREIRSDR